MKKRLRIAHFFKKNLHNGIFQVAVTLLGYLTPVLPSCDLVHGIVLGHCKKIIGFIVVGNGRRFGSAAFFIFQLENNWCKNFQFGFLPLSKRARTNYIKFCSYLGFVEN